MNSRGSRRLFLLLLALYAGWGLFYIYRSSFVVDGTRVFLLWDDALVSMRYAKNLATGHGLVWNPGAERVQGFTNLGITLFLAAIHLLPVSPQKICLVFQLVNLGLLLGCAALTRRIAEQVWNDAAVGLAAAALVMLCGPLAILSLQGTDVGVLTAVLLGATTLIVAPLSERRPFPRRVFLVLAAGVLVRLDFSVTYALFAVAALISAGSRRRMARAAIEAGVPLAATLTGMLTFGYLYYGDALPNTYYLKATGSSRRAVLESSIVQLEPLLNARILLVLAFTVATAAVYHRRNRVVLFFAALCGTMYAYNFWVGGDYVFRTCSRFLAPGLPLYIVVFVGSALRLVSGVRRGALRPEQRTALFGALCGVSVLGFNTSVSLGEWVTATDETMRLWDSKRRYPIGIYLRDHASPDAVIGVHGAGIIPYFSNLPALDMFGKCDRHIGKMKIDEDTLEVLAGHRFLPGHSKFDWDYVMSKQPDLIDGTYMGLGKRKDFRALYRLATANEPYGDVFFFMRKGSPHEIVDPALHVQDILPQGGVAPAHMGEDAPE